MSVALCKRLGVKLSLSILGYHVDEFVVRAPIVNLAPGRAMSSNVAVYLEAWRALHGSRVLPTSLTACNFKGSLL